MGKFKNPRSYLIKMENSKLSKRNVVPIRKRKALLYEGNIGVTKNSSIIGIIYVGHK